MMDKDLGRDNRLSQAEPASGLGPSGFDPSRVEPVQVIDEMLTRIRRDIAILEAQREALLISRADKRLNWIDT